LKSVLDAKVFACLARRLQTEEIRAAMIPDLETCPSCPFSYIPDENSLVFECMEETCKKITCRYDQSMSLTAKLIFITIPVSARSLTICH
jgi:hypothetical protein